jgi:DNA modification methylase
MLWNNLELPPAYYYDDAVYIINADCRDILPLIPDKSIDLVLTDPPYGLNTKMQGGTWGIKFKHSDMKDWDYVVGQCLIDAIIQKGTNAIIWGGNNYVMPPSRCYLAWDKTQKLGTLADFELAWTNFDRPCKSWQERRNHAENGNEHPTQKPISLFKWCLQFTNGELILDPFMGSGTSLRASKEIGRKCIGIEIEEKYCEIAAKRCSQTVMNLEVETSKETASTLPMDLENK